MAVTYTRNLKLRIDSNLTANSKYNLERLDLLGGTFLVDTTDTLNLRSRTNIVIEPESSDIGGSGQGGTVSLGSANHVLASIGVFSQTFNLSNRLGLKDQATGGTNYAYIQYKSDLSGSADTLDRVLSIDLDGADRSVVLGGDLSSVGGSLQLNLSGATSLILPQTGTLSTLSGSEVLTNKVIDASQNALSNITNASISNSAGIIYSKLALSDSISDSDISTSAQITRSKIANGTANYVLINNGSGNLSEEQFLDKSRGGTGIASTANFPVSGMVLSDDNAATINNKAIDGNNNTFSNIPYTALLLGNSITNSDLAPGFAIGYERLDISGRIVNTDISALASIDGSKISAQFGNQLVGTSLSFQLHHSDNIHTIDLAPSLAPMPSSITLYLPPNAGTIGQLLTTDGNGNTSWIDPPTSTGGAVNSYTGTWTSSDGTDIIITHGLASKNVVVSLIDESDNTLALLDNVVVLDTNAIHLYASESPATTWKVVVHA